MNLESVAARGSRAGGETGCYPYFNVARTPMNPGLRDHEIRQQAIKKASAVVDLLKACLVESNLGDAVDNWLREVHCIKSPQIFST